MDRTFELQEAKREQVPLLVGLSGASGCGKTYSALRIATGIQEVTGGEIAVIDTEARRALHYADLFTFKHLEFREPFGSVDYLKAIRHCHQIGAKVIIVDSMSHEHEGIGGLLDLHETELERLTRGDHSKREAMKFLAWQVPKANRRKLINGLLQLQGNFIFCFRAKQSIKPMKVQDKTKFVPQGFLPIAGEEFVFEQTVNILLPPASGGVPSWESEYIGERTMMKLPKQFESLFAESKPLDEQIGRTLAEWAKGDESRPAPTQTASTPTREQYLEAIKEEFLRAGLGGTEEKIKQRKHSILAECFGTRSWKRIANEISVEELRAGLGRLEDQIKQQPETDPDTGEEIPPEIGREQEDMF